MRNWIAVPVLAGVLLAGGVAVGQVEMRIEADVVSSEEVMVDLVIDNAAAPIRGWAFTFCHDGEVLQPVDVVDGTAFDTVAALFNSHTFFDSGVYVAVALNFSPDSTLALGSHEVHEVIYEVESSVDQTELTFCETTEIIAGSGIGFANEGENFVVDVVDALVVFSGEASVFDFTVSSAIVGYDLAIGEATFDVAANIAQDGGTGSNDTFGFSMGLSHDPDVLSLASVEFADAMDDLRGGLGPEFADISELDNGITVSVVYSLMLEETMEFTSSTQVLELEYETVPAALVDVLEPTETQLRWSDTLGDPRVRNAVVHTADGDLAFVVRNHGTITLVPGGGAFIRGDATGNGFLDLGDAIKVLGYLFLSRSIGCEDAADIDDDGTADIADAVGLLSYLFLDGDAPSAPFLACGGDSSADLLSCTDAGSCD